MKITRRIMTCQTLCALAALLAGCGGGGGNAIVSATTPDLVTLLDGTKWRAVSVSAFSKIDDKVETDACPGTVTMAPATTGDPTSGPEYMACGDSDTITFSRVSNHTGDDQIVGTRGDGASMPVSILYGVVNGQLLYSPLGYGSGLGISTDPTGHGSFVTMYSVTFSGAKMTITQASTTATGDTDFNGSSITYERQ